MFDTPRELLERIRLGEDSLLELKSVRFKGKRVAAPDRKDLADEIAAIANTHSGVLVLGVNDKTHDIEGISLDQLDAVERYIYEICTQSIEPEVQFIATRMNLPDGTGNLQAVLKVDIPHSPDLHQSPHGHFHRQGSSTRRMSREILQRSFLRHSESGIIKFEELPIPQSSIDDLNPNLWKNYITRSNEPAEVALLKRGLLSKGDDGTARASIAGILLCCDHPENFRPSAFIQAVRYRGVKQDSNYQIDAQKICGPLDQQISQSMSFLRKNQTTAAIKMPHRIEKAQFDERAVFEAIVNAVAHRDYSITSSKIRFFLFDDRLEIYSPGALPNTVTIETIAVRQATRNELITSLLSETPVTQAPGDIGREFYMEKRGDGVRIIFDRSEAHSGIEPAYQLIDNTELLLTIFSASMEPSDED